MTKEFPNGPISFEELFGEIRERLDEINSIHVNQAAKLDNCQEFIRIIGQNVHKLGLLDDIRTEIHELRDALVKPIVKLFGLLIFSVLLVGGVAVAVSIGIRTLHVSATDGIGYDLRDK